MECEGLQKAWEMNKLIKDNDVGFIHILEHKVGAKHASRIVNRITQVWSWEHN